MLAQTSRVTKLPWANVGDALWQDGFSRLGILLSQSECEELRQLYPQTQRFRSRIEMARYRFGKGEYQYFAYPLPELVSYLRCELYTHLAPMANSWMAALHPVTPTPGVPGTPALHPVTPTPGVPGTPALGGGMEFPPGFDAFLALCRDRGQSRPTPLLLRYQASDFNCLHQDIYGELVFPFQVIVALSDPVVEYSGGELLLVEQRPRAQSRGHAIRLAQGEAVVISTRFRPVRSARGFYRANVRHGVSTVTSGERFTLGIVFHDSK